MFMYMCIYIYIYVYIYIYIYTYIHLYIHKYIHIGATSRGELTGFGGAKSTPHRCASIAKPIGDFRANHLSNTTCLTEAFFKTGE